MLVPEAKITCSNKLHITKNLKKHLSLGEWEKNNLNAFRKVQIDLRGIHPALNPSQVDSIYAWHPHHSGYCNHVQQLASCVFPTLVDIRALVTGLLMFCVPLRSQECNTLSNR